MNVSRNTLQSDERERSHFDKHATSYDVGYRYKEPFTKYKIEKKSREFVNFVAKHKERAGLKILDLGCGTGEYTSVIVKKLPKCTFKGLDISRKMVNIAKTKCKGITNVTFVVKSAYRTGYKENYFDVVYGFYVLHHLDLSRVNREIYRILKPSGIAFFCEPNILNPLVYIIKSNRYLKRKIGDSSDEWAINPLTFKKFFPQFETDLSLKEYVWPVGFLGLNLLQRLDKIFSFLGKIPLLKYLGGSVQIELIK